jgi:hypothetical protein
LLRLHGHRHGCELFVAKADVLQDAPYLDKPAAVFAECVSFAISLSA